MCCGEANRNSVHKVENSSAHKLRPGWCLQPLHKGIRIYPVIYKKGGGVEFKAAEETVKFRLPN